MNKINKTGEDWVLDRCICKKCPTFDDCGEKGGYCYETISGSRCITDDNKCICAKCSVFKEKGWRFKLFCIKGSESQQSEM